MNKAGRKELKEAYDLLYRARDIVEYLENKEGEKYENLPDSLLNTDQAVKMEEAKDTLEYAFCEIEATMDELSEIM